MWLRVTASPRASSLCVLHASRMLVRAMGTAAPATTSFSGSPCIRIEPCPERPASNRVRRATGNFARSSCEDAQDAAIAPGAVVQIVAKALHEKGVKDWLDELSPAEYIMAGIGGGMNFYAAMAWLGRSHKMVEVVETEAKDVEDSESSTFVRVIGPVKGPIGPPLKVLRSALTPVPAYTTFDYRASLRHVVRQQFALIWPGPVHGVALRVDDTLHYTATDAIDAVLGGAAGSRCDSEWPLPAGTRVWARLGDRSRAGWTPCVIVGSKESKSDFARFYTCHDEEKDIVFHNVSSEWVSTKNEFEESLDDTFEQAERFSAALFFESARAHGHNVSVVFQCSDPAPKEVEVSLDIIGDVDDLDAGVPPFQGALVPGVMSVVVAPIFTGIPVYDLSNCLIALGCYATFAAGIHVFNKLDVWGFSKNQLRVKAKDRGHTRRTRQESETRNTSKLK